MSAKPDIDIKLDGDDTIDIKIVDTNGHDVFISLRFMSKFIGVLIGVVSAVVGYVVLV